MTRNGKKILSLILILILLFVVLPIYFIFGLDDVTQDFISKKFSKNNQILAAGDDWQAEQYVGFDVIEATKAKKFLISTSDKRASKIGAKILEKGGNAIDAVIAAQMVLNVVEPQSSGIGGGAFLLYFDNKTKKTHYFNGRETAPIKANSEIFLSRDSNPKKFHDAVKGGLSVGTPALLKMLKTVHDKYGELDWDDLFEEAIKLAKTGFPMDRKIHELAADLSYLKDFDDFSEIYLNEDGKPKKIGKIIKNPDLAKTLEIIADEGIEPFYEGKIAKNIVKTVQNSKINPGFLSLEDLKEYEVEKEDLICRPYRKFKICSVNLPSSGGITLLQILGILENFDLNKYEPSSSEAIHLISQATKLAYLDRNRYIADIDSVPISKMLDKKYLKKRSQLIKEDKILENIESGDFKNWKYAMNNNAHENPSTTHISVIDKEGNAIAMTSSIEYIFGSALMVDGFLLNNQLTDFSFVPEIDGKKVANNLQPRKQPRSSMTPTFVFDENDDLLLVLGSPGGPRIIQYVLKTIIAYLDWNLSLEKSVALPNFIAIKDRIELEKNTKLEKIKLDLIDLGHKVKIRNMTSGINAIAIDKKHNILIGSADFRRNGAAVGQ